MKVLRLPTRQTIVNPREESALLQICLAPRPTKSSRFAEMLTLSQLAGISYHRAIDRTQCTILRDQSYDPSTVLKHTMFTQEPRSMKHYNTIKYDSIKRKCLFSVQQIARQRGIETSNLDSPIPWLHDASSLPIRVLPSCSGHVKGHDTICKLLLDKQSS